MDPFATLGLPRRFALDARQLEANYRELQRVLHPDRHSGASASQRRMNLLKAVEVNEAYRVLRHEVSRADALLTAFAGASGVPRGAEDPEFLMHMLEQREELAQAHAEADTKRITALSERIEADAQRTRTELDAAFERLSAAAGGADLAVAAALLGRLKYFHRFLDEVGALEERRVS